jgi:predicted DsbA family dithiol-disulfide isomerase
MQVEIWSDVACPWCYIGKRRFEGALKQFKHRDQVEVIWRSYQLDPDAPRGTGQNVNEILEKKMHLSREKALALNDHVSALAAQEGLDYHMEKAQYDNSFDAHRLVHLAAAHGKQDAMEERLFKAYFTDGIAIGEKEALIQLADEIGLDAAEARATLESDAYAAEVQADIARADAFGIQGVPFFAIDETYGISGAQSADLFKSTMEEIWTKSHPLIQLGSTSPNAAGQCTDESCSTS